MHSPSQTTPCGVPPKDYWPHWPAVRACPRVPSGTPWPTTWLFRACRQCRRPKYPGDTNQRPWWVLHSKSIPQWSPRDSAWQTSPWPRCRRPWPPLQFPPCRRPRSWCEPRQGYCPCCWLGLHWGQSVPNRAAHYPDGYTPGAHLR